MNETTGLQRALDAHDVPKEKWTQMVQRTIIGTVLTAAGGFVVVEEVLKADRSTMLVIIGLIAIVVGCTTWSSQIVTSSFKALKSPAKAIRELLKGKS